MSESPAIRKKMRRYRKTALIHSHKQSPPGQRNGRARTATRGHKAYL